MVREKHSVYIDTERFNQAKARGINVSEVVENALKKLSQDEDFEYTLHLDYLDSQIKDREQKLDAIIDAKTVLEKQLAMFKTEYRRIAKQYKMEESSIAMSRLLAALNRAIHECKYDIASIKIAAGEILTQIYKLNRGFNLERHVNIVEETYNN